MDIQSDLTVATIGNVDSGKSTLVGVLTKSILDDGRGYARSKVFNFGHEQQNGRTSSIAHEIMGFRTVPEEEANSNSAPTSLFKTIGDGKSAKKSAVTGATTSVATGAAMSTSGAAEGEDGNSNLKDSAGDATGDAPTSDSTAAPSSSTVPSSSGTDSVTVVEGSKSGGKSDKNSNKLRFQIVKEDLHENPKASTVEGSAMSGKEVVKPDANKTSAKTATQKTASWSKIQSNSDRIIQFVDLCGHEKYLKTTIFGLVGLCPDYALVVVNANAGLQRMTREHIGIAIALRIPIIIVVTKKDITPENVYQQNMVNITKILKSNAMKRMPVFIKSNEGTEIENAAASILSERVVPVFSVSSVTGDGLDYLRTFLYNLKPRAKDFLCRSPSDPLMEFHIESVFLVAGVGVVVAGFVKSGQCTVGSHVYLGPDSLGKYKHLIIRGIHIRRVPHPRAISGEHCSFALRAVDAREKFKKSHFRKGMVLLSTVQNHDVAFREFEAEIVILHHSTTIRKRYQAVIHCGVIRQSAEVLAMNSELLRTGDKAIVRFRFLYHVEYLREGWTILFREGRTKGIGKIIKTIPFQLSEGPTDPNPNIKLKE